MLGRIGGIGADLRRQVGSGGDAGEKAVLSLDMRALFRDHNRRGHGSLRQVRGDGDGGTYDAGEERAGDDRRGDGEDGAHHTYSRASSAAHRSKA